MEEHERTYHQQLNMIFKDFSFEILKYLDNKDIYSLRLTNKYIFDIMECHLMFKGSMKEIDNLFTSIVNIPEEPKTNKSKFCI